MAQPTRAPPAVARPQGGSHSIRGRACPSHEGPPPRGAALEDSSGRRVPEAARAPGHLDVLLPRPGGGPASPATRQCAAAGRRAPAPAAAAARRRDGRRLPQAPYKKEEGHGSPTGLLPGAPAGPDARHVEGRRSQYEATMVEARRRKVVCGGESRRPRRLEDHRHRLYARA